MIRQSAMTLVGRVVPAAVGLGSVCIYTRLLDPASVGVYALLLSSSLLASGIGFAWLRNAVLRVISGEPDGEMAPHIAATVGLAFVGTALVIATLETSLLHVLRPGIPALSIALATTAALASAWNDLNSSLLQARLRFVAWGFLNLSRALGALAATVVLIACGLKTDALLGGFIIGNCAALACLGSWRTAARGSFDRELFARMMRFGWPLSVKGGFEQVAPAVQRYVIDYSVGATAVGLFAVATDFTAQTLASIIGSISLAGIPLAFRAKDRGGAPAVAAQMAKNARLIFAISAPLGLGIIVLAQPIASVFFGSNFRAGADTIIAIIVVASLLTNVRSYYFDQSFELAYRTRPQAWISAIVAIVAIVGSMLLIPRFASIGAACANVLAAAVGLAMSAVWGAAILRVPIPARSCVKTAIATIAMTGVLVVIPKHGGLFELIVLAIVGALVYGSVAAALRFDFIRATFVRRASLSQT